MLNNKTQKQAFTLVELIVVIVILAILATIAFLSFSSQSSSARDSNRLANIANISKGLIVFYTVGGTFPTPDNPIAITASGNLIKYQGIAGNSVTKMIKLSADGGKDPLDNNYFSYITNSKKNKYQLLGFLENMQNSEMSFNPFEADSKASADVASNSGKYLFTRGDLLGVLMESGTTTPIVASATNTGVDILNTNKTYTVYYSKNETVTGTGIALKSGISGGGIVGYWGFDEGTGTGINDLSMNGHDAVLNGPPYPIWTSGPNGKTPEYTLWQTASIPAGSISNYGDGDYSLSFNFYYSGSLGLSCGNGYTRVISNNNFPNRWFVIDLCTNMIEYEGGVQNNGNFVFSNGTFTYTLQPNNWYNITFVGYKAGRISAYVNGNNIGTNKYTYDTYPSTSTLYRTGSLTDIPNGIFYDSTRSIDIGAMTSLTGSLKIDEIRMYNRALSDFEVESISALTR